VWHDAVTSGNREWRRARPPVSGWTYAITATYSGDSNHKEFGDVGGRQVVNQASQTITVTVPLQQLQPTRAASRGGERQFGLAITFTSAGACTKQARRIR